jgi:hypothetical protein
MTTATAPHIEDIVANLRARLVALGDGGDATSENERVACRRDTDAIQRTITGLVSASEDLTRAAQRLATGEADHAAVIAKCQEIADALAAADDWHKATDSRERDRAFDHEQHLRAQMDALVHGQLLYAPGQAYESLDSLDRRIKDQTTRRDRSQRALDGFLQQAAALLEPEET